MLITIQFPLADMRPFAPGRQRRLTKPAWPDAHPGGEFVRGIGGIDFRRLGGLNGWIGEGTHCRASRLILLDKLPRLAVSNQTDLPFDISSRVKFRRLFADGVALAKYEIGVAGSLSYAGDWGVDFNLSKIIDDILTQRCRVPGVAAGSLLFSGKFLATRYLECSSQRTAIQTDDARSENADEVGVVVAGDPLVFIDLSSDRISLPEGYTAVTMPGNFAFQIFYGHHTEGALRVPVWVLLRPQIGAASDSSARHLRIYLQRIHAEKEVLRLVLNNIASGRLKPTEDRAASDALQRYLLESTSRIGRLEFKADKNAIAGIGALAASCLEFVRPGWRDALTQRMELLNIRPNIRRNIESRVRRENTWINFGAINIEQSHHDNRRGTFMGDTFSNIQNSTIINRSQLENAFNKIKSGLGEETATILLKVAELIAQSGNKEAGELLDQFNEELGKPQPRKSLLKRSWDGLVTALPAVTSIAGAAAAIAKLFT